jgi:hypothetical protein
MGNPEEKKKRLACEWPHVYYCRDLRPSNPWKFLKCQGYHQGQESCLLASSDFVVVQTIQEQNNTPAGCLYIARQQGKKTHLHTIQVNWSFTSYVVSLEPIFLDYFGVQKSLHVG